MMPDPGAKAATPRWRLLLWVVIVAIAGLRLWADPTDGVSRVASLLILIGLLVALAFAAEYVELRTQRPRKTYLRWALAVAVLGLALVVMPLAIGAGVVIGLMLWVGFAAAGLAWVHYYERTEPL